MVAYSNYFVLHYKISINVTPYIFNREYSAVSLNKIYTFYSVSNKIMTLKYVFMYIPPIGSSVFELLCLALYNNYQWYEPPLQEKACCRLTVTSY